MPDAIILLLLVVVVVVVARGYTTTMDDNDLDRMLEAAYEPKKEDNNTSSDKPQPEADKEKETKKDSPTNKDKDDKDKDRDRSRDRDRDRRRRSSRSRSRDRSRRSSRDRHRDRRDRDRDRERRRSRSPRRERRRSPSPARYSPPAPLTDEERDMRTVMVMQLPRKCMPRDLMDHFAAAGKVRDAKLIADRNSRRSKGIAYVEFYDPESVPKALAMNGIKLGPAPLIIMMTQSEKNRQAALKEKEQSAGGPCRISVQNLPYSVTTFNLNQLFKPFADTTNSTIRDSAIIPDPQGRGSSGCGFVEFETASAAQMAVESMNNFQIPGTERTIRVSLAASDPMSHSLDPIHPVLDREETDHTGIQMSATSRIELMNKLAGGAPTLPPTPVPSAVAPPMGSIPTKQLLLKNMFDPAKETEVNWDHDIRDEVLEECSKMGDVVHIFVDKNSKGHVYVKFKQVEAAARAKQTMHGRFFDQAQITVEFLELARYTAKFPESANAGVALHVA
eukprot:m.40239 g.40239  ORF g.40239 m.40239 type:complete len:504 (-) comp9640_c1_seq1:303-1814(-)